MSTRKGCPGKGYQKKSVHCPGSDSNADREVKLATQANLKKTYRAGLIEYKKDIAKKDDVIRKREVREAETD